MIARAIFVQAHPPPQYLPQDGAVMGPHHQSGPGVFGPCDGNFDKEKVTYDGPTSFHRGMRYENDSSMMGGEPIMFNRAIFSCFGKNRLLEADLKENKSGLNRLELIKICKVDQNIPKMQKYRYRDNP
ncbi:unnamed protein product [Haemonchus placei]|uniref:Uncharacterized protein n=1 Tax=Haemonchus placei TaxID=6290 RepID=A0A0N4VYJ8_HAEPC|nr:unnamed protein product [Haemonchus placei]